MLPRGRKRSSDDFVEDGFDAFQSDDDYESHEEYEAETAPPAKKRTRIAPAPAAQSADKPVVLPKWMRGIEKKIGTAPWWREIYKTDEFWTALAQCPPRIFNKRVKASAQIVVDKALPPKGGRTPRIRQKDGLASVTAPHTPVHTQHSQPASATGANSGLRPASEIEDTVMVEALPRLDIGQAHPGRGAEPSLTPAEHSTTAHVKQEREVSEATKVAAWAASASKTTSLAKQDVLGYSPKTESKSESKASTQRGTGTVVLKVRRHEDEKAVAKNEEAVGSDAVADVKPAINHFEQHSAPRSSQFTRNPSLSLATSIEDNTGLDRIIRPDAWYSVMLDGRPYPVWGRDINHYNSGGRAIWVARIDGVSRTVQRENVRLLDDSMMTRMSKMEEDAKPGSEIQVSAMELDVKPVKLET